MSGPPGCYGARQGYNYSLSEFQALDSKFKRDWISKKGSNLVPEKMCEEAFWRTVEDPSETCQVEYGQYKSQNNRYV